MSGPPLPPSLSSSPADGPSGPREAERDAWLHAALRHAPDADAAPPDALRKSILDEARAAAFAHAQAASRQQATRTAALEGSRGLDARGVIRAAGAFWSWLARPAVATGFASVMAATLVGVMWWGRPLDEALPSATPSVAAPRQASAAAERAEVSAAPAPPAALSTPEVARQANKVAKPLPTDALNGRRSASKIETDEDKKRLPANAPATGPAPGSTTSLPESAGAAAAPQPFPAAAANAFAPLAKAAPAAPPAAPLAELKDSLAPPRQARESIEERRRVAPPSAADATVAQSAAPAPARLQPQARLALGASVASVAAPAPASRPLGEIVGSIASDPARWSVQLPNGERVSVDDALRAWLARVDGTAGWTAPDAVADASSAILDKADGPARTAPATTLTLLRDGQRDAVIRIEANRVIVERHATGARASSVAPLSAQAAAALAASLPSTAR